MNRTATAIVTKVLAGTLQVRDQQASFNAVIASSLATTPVATGDIVALAWQGNTAYAVAKTGHRAGTASQAGYHQNILTAVNVLWQTDSSYVTWSDTPGLASYYIVDATASVPVAGALLTAARGYPALSHTNSHLPIYATPLYFRVRYISADGRSSPWSGWFGPWGNPAGISEDSGDTGQECVWLPLPDGGYFPGNEIGPNIEVRRVYDLDDNGDPYLDTGGEQQQRALLEARGQNGVPGVVMLSGTKRQPDRATLLLLSDPPQSYTDIGSRGELRIGPTGLWACVEDDLWVTASSVAGGGITGSFTDAYGDVYDVVNGLIVAVHTADGEFGQWPIGAWPLGYDTSTNAHTLLCSAIDGGSFV
jgi:hypothetical protein